RLNTQRALVPTQYVKEKNRERKLAAYRHTVIRIPVGNDRLIQAQFQSAEPVSRLFEWIRSIISRDVPFSLKLALVYKIEESTSKNFVDADLAPKSTVVIRFKDSVIFGTYLFETSVNVTETILLRDSFRECTQDEADKLCSTWLSENTIFKPYTAIIEEEERTAKRPGDTMTSASSEFRPPPHKANSAPRWLKKK
ncbi:hypothetical protein OSTOST_24183, partial [Ostertagia ostertagi]